MKKKYGISISSFKEYNRLKLYLEDKGIKNMIRELTIKKYIESNIFTIYIYIPEDDENFITFSTGKTMNYFNGYIYKYMTYKEFIKSGILDEIITNKVS